MLIAIAIILTPLILYLACAFGVRKQEVSDPDDFFLAYRKIGTTPFSNSSIAYAFQVATVFPFLAWAATGQLLAPVLNGVFWGLGILFFLRCVRRYEKFFGSNDSLHGLLGKTHAAPSIRVLTSILTTIGLLGIAVAETYWGSQVLITIIPDKRMIYLIMFLCVYFVFTYIAYGGQVSSIRTDQVQLIVTYLGIIGLLLYLLYFALKKGVQPSVGLGWALIGLIIYITAIPQDLKEWAGTFCVLLPHGRDE